jgi:hypothetical protein
MFNKLRTPCGNICYNLFQVLHIALRIKGSAETSKGIRLSLTTVFAKIVKAAVIESPISAQTFSMFFFISLPGIHNSTKTPMFSGFLVFLVLFPFEILSAVINDWEQIEVIVPGGCYLDINIIRKIDRKIKMLQ